MRCYCEVVNFSILQKMSLFIIGKIKNNKELSNFFLEDSRDPKKLKTFTSKTAYLSGNKNNPQIVLKDGSAQTYLNRRKVT